MCLTSLWMSESVCTSCCVSRLPALSIQVSRRDFTSNSPSPVWSLEAVCKLYHWHQKPVQMPGWTHNKVVWNRCYSPTLLDASLVVQPIHSVEFRGSPIAHRAAGAAPGLGFVWILVVRLSLFEIQAETFLQSGACCAQWLRHWWMEGPCFLLRLYTVFLWCTQKELGGRWVNMLLIIVLLSLTAKHDWNKFWPPVLCF